MNYSLAYNRLIDKARNRTLRADTYFERHHIVPKSLGGTNDKCNIVHLYPREHYIAHLLLFKLYDTLYTKFGTNKNEYIKMLWALSALYWLPAKKTETGLRLRAFKGNSHIYAQFKIKFASIQGKKNKERITNLSSVLKKEISDKIKAGLRAYYASNPGIWSGRHHSYSTKLYLSKIKKGTGCGKENSLYGSFWGYNVSTNEVKKFKKTDTLPDGWAYGRGVKTRYNETLYRLDNSSKLDSKILLLTAMYNDYCKMPFLQVALKYGYTYSRPNFLMLCKKYVKEFRPQNGKKRIYII